MIKIKHKAELENLRDIKEILSQFLHDNSVSEEQSSDIELAVEELLVNVMSYSYPDSAGYVELVCEEDRNKLILRIIDEGIPFDPTKSAVPDLDEPIEERGQGGMGIHLAKNLVDEINYIRSENQNILSLSVIIK
jgi:serine/threonine-protein kinase RsbW